MYLLDTNVLSELRKSQSGMANKRVVAWADKVTAASLFVSAISIGEIEVGTLLMERRDRKQGVVLRQWLNAYVLPSFAGRILAVDTAVALRCAQLHVPNRQSSGDAFIAATALVHGLIVVTRNVADFEPTGVEILNPWE